MVTMAAGGAGSAPSLDTYGKLRHRRRISLRLPSMTMISSAARKVYPILGEVAMVNMLAEENCDHVRLQALPNGSY